MPDPFTIRIFVPDGDSEGVRLIDRMNWTGLGIVFPREKWPEVRKRGEMDRAGIYVLDGSRTRTTNSRRSTLGKRTVCAVASTHMPRTKISGTGQLSLSRPAVD